MFRLALFVFGGVIIVIAAFAFFIPHTNRGDELAPPVVVESKPLVAVTYTGTYKNGLHSLKGSVLAPTPCTELSATAAVASGTPQIISVELSMPPDTGICLQKLTELPFSVTASAGADAKVEVFVNGEPASTTVKAL